MLFRFNEELKKIFNIEPYIGIEESFDFINFNKNRLNKTNYYQTQFEELIKNFIKTDKEICVLNSGTSAIHLALILSGVKEGDTVFCPSSSFIATVNPILYLNAKPYFVDVDIRTGNIKPEYLENAIVNSLRSKENPKAIIITHSYGNPADLNKLKIIARKYNLKLIEDAAEAVGSYYRGNHCGIIGDYGVFSFNTNKIATSLGGGALVVNNFNEKIRVQNLSTQYKKNGHSFIHEFLGYNYKLNDLSAYLGCLQFHNLNYELERKQIVYDWYKKAFTDSKINHYSFFVDNKDVANKWMNCISFEEETTKSKVQNYCLNRGIEVRDYWYPLHIQQYLKHFCYEGNEESTILNKQIFCLPSSIELEKKHVELIVKIVKEGLRLC